METERKKLNGNGNGCTKKIKQDIKNLNNKKLNNQVNNDKLRPY